jgi:THO complex subunit 3
MAVECVAWPPNNDGELASVSRDGTLRFWDVRAAKCLKEIKLPGEKLFTLTYHPDGTYVCIGSEVSI